MAKRRSVKPETQLKHALRALERGQYQQALGRLENLLPLTQDDPVLAEQVHLAKADAYLNLRDLPQAIEYAEAAIKLNPAGERGYYLLGFAHSVKTDWAKAIPALRQAMALNPDEPEYYRSLGWALFNQDQTKQEGQALLEKALNMDPTHISTLTDLAMLYGQEQHFERALIFARRAVQLAPSDPLAQEVLAGLTHFKQEFERLGAQPASKPAPKPSTEAEWRELIAAGDDFNQVMQLWVDLHSAKGIDDLNASLKQFRELWNSTPRPELGGHSPYELLGRGGEKE